MASVSSCVSCNVMFQDGELQRLHYKTDWHRYNLKRKIAELPPVTSEEFRNRVLLQQSKEKQDEKTKEYCIICRKSFSNNNAYLNHINSKKHKLMEEENKNFVNNHITEELQCIKPVINENEESDVEDVDSDEWNDDTENPIDSNKCIFCLHQSKSFVKCIKHMSVEHSFFIPDAEYCIDIEGLLKYLGEKIMIGFMCLWCNEKGKSFHSAQAAQQHMIDKGHCKMIHEGDALLEYADFYDYSSSYPDANDENVDSEEEVKIPEIDCSDYQLVLPSGSTIGHRSLMRYYKQSIVRNPETSSKKLNKVIAHYRSLGWTSTQKEIISRKARDLQYMKKMESKWKLKLSLKSNKFQPHFRQQVNF